MSYLQLYILSSCAFTTVLFLALFLMYRVTQSIPGGGWLAAGYGALSLGLLFWFVWTKQPAPVLAFLRISFEICGCLLLLSGIRRYLEIKLFSGPMALTGVLGIGLVALLTFAVAQSSTLHLTAASIFCGGAIILGGQSILKRLTKANMAAGLATGTAFIFSGLVRLIYPGAEAAAWNAPLVILIGQAMILAGGLGLMVVIIQTKTDQSLYLAEELQAQATIDPMSGLYNRRRFMELANIEIERSRLFGHGLAVLIIEIDYFKKVNDQFGREAGLKALRAVAEQAKEALRRIDIVGRVGDEALAVVLPETDYTVAIEAAEQMRFQVGELKISTEQSEFGVTVSVGVSALIPADETIDDVFLRSDAALFQAKETGRNRVVTG